MTAAARSVRQAPGARLPAPAGSGSREVRRPRLVRLDEVQRAFANHLLGRAAVSDFALRSETLQWRWQERAEVGPADVTLVCAAGPLRCALGIDIDHGPGLDDAIDLEPFTGTALLAAAGVRYAAVLAHLERLGGFAFELVEVQRQTAFAFDMPTLHVGFELTSQAGAAARLRGVLRVPASQAASWMGLKGRPAPLPPPGRAVPLEFELWLDARVPIDVASLRRLRSGAALLLGPLPEDGLRCRLCGADPSRGWQVTLHASQRIQVRSAPGVSDDPPATRSPAMQATDSHERADAAATAAALDALPVALEFQIGRVCLPLAELPSALAPGCVIDLGRPLDTTCVAVRANGQLLARGELVQLGDQMAVRISRIAGDDGPV